MHDKVQLAPLLGDLIEHGFHLSGNADIKRHDDGGLERARQRINVLSGLVVEVSDCEICTEGAEGCCTTPGNGLLVRDADDESLFPLQQLGLDGWNQSSLAILRYVERLSTCVPLGSLF